MTGAVHYHSFIACNQRWEHVRLRPGDVVLSTPSKSGTTWTQVLTLLLLHDGLPSRPVNEVSIWPDLLLRSTEDMVERLEAVAGRRCIKTHTPLDGLPRVDGVTYVTVARDPRDVFVSMQAHLANSRDEDVEELRRAAVGMDDLAELEQLWPQTDDPGELRAAFVDLPAGTNSAGVQLAHLLRHLRLAWEARGVSSHHLLHFADLLSDPVGEALRLRDALGVDVTEERVAALVPLASFDALRDRASEVAPEAGTGIWKDPAAFFRRGRIGDGARAMPPEERRRYAERCRELSDDVAFLDWVHGGRARTGPSWRAPARATTTAATV